MIVAQKKPRHPGEGDQTVLTTQLPQTPHLFLPRVWLKQAPRAARGRWSRILGWLGGGGDRLSNRWTCEA